MDIDTLSRELVRKILESDKVIIVPHNKVDFDAIGSAIGLSFIVKELGRQAFIIVNDSIHSLDAGVKIIIEESKKNYQIINKERYRAIAGDNDLYILTDVNRKKLISIPEFLKNPENIMIVDHHNIYDETVESNYKYINNEHSSASEIVVTLLDKYYALGLISNNIANYLYAGIYLDTGQLKKNYTSATMMAIAKLLDNGTSAARVNTWFKEDFNSDRKVQNLINSAQMINFSIALIIATEDVEYSREEIAKAADYGLNYSDVSFAIGMIEDDIVSISGRSTGRVNIGAIMADLGGGGSITSGATKLTDISVNEASKKLRKVLKPSYYIEE